MASKSPSSDKITLKTETERLLFEYYKNEKTSRMDLERQVTDLQTQLANLHEQLQLLQQNREQARDIPVTQKKQTIILRKRNVLTTARMKKS